jgi:ABC-type multidrug transport system ATPase subunit
MHEHALNGIGHLFAVFCARSGARKDEAVRRVVDYLVGTLGLRRSDPSFGIFSDLLELYSGPVDSAAPETALAGVCERLAEVLSPDEKQSFLLHSLQVRQALPEVGEGADRLLARAAEAFRVPEAEWTAWRRFVAAGPDLAGEGLCRRFGRAGWRAELAVLHSPWTGRYFVRALRGEVSLDDNPVAAGRFYPLEPGAILRDAGGQAVYRCEIERPFGGAAAFAPIRFEAEAVEYRFPGGETGIKDFSFRETGGRLIAVMGGSGVGKSTLVQLLNGSLTPQAGRVLLNGIDLHRNPAALEGVVGTVPQDDLLFEDLTVRENLDYNARLCLAGLTETERGERVRRMLAELRQEEIADLKVGDPLAKTISGGQRKRLNIALELIREPSVLFVDEPTSGLSSADSDVVMGLLKAQAARGRLVIAIVHQPSSNLFRQFDALWILDKGGVPVYMGHPLEAARHFRAAAHLAGGDRGVCPECGNVHPEQIFALIESKATDPDGRFTRARQFPPEFWHDAWRKTVPPPAAAGAPVGEPPPRHLSRPGWIGQLRVVLWRPLRARLANRAYRWVNLLEPPLLAGLTVWLCRARPARRMPSAAILSGRLFLHGGHRGDFPGPERQRRGNRSRSPGAAARAVPAPELERLFRRENPARGRVGPAADRDLRGDRRRRPARAGLLRQAVARALFGGRLRRHFGPERLRAVQVRRHRLRPVAAAVAAPDAAGRAHRGLRRPAVARRAACVPAVVRRTDGFALGLRGVGRRAVPGQRLPAAFRGVDRELSGLDYRANDHVPALLGRLDALLLARRSAARRSARCWSASSARWKPKRRAWPAPRPRSRLGAHRTAPRWSR